MVDRNPLDQEDIDNRGESAQESITAEAVNLSNTRVGFVNAELVRMNGSNARPVGRPQELIGCVTAGAGINRLQLNMFTGENRIFT